MIDTKFRSRLEEFSNGHAVRTACKAKTGASAWWTAALLAGAAASAILLPDRAGTTTAAIVCGILMFAATAAWISRETFAIALTERELLVISTNRIARSHPRGLVQHIPVDDVVLTVSTSPTGVATMCIGETCYDVPSTDFSKANRLGEVAQASGTQLSFS